MLAPMLWELDLRRETHSLPLALVLSLCPSEAQDLLLFGSSFLFFPRNQTIVTCTSCNTTNHVTDLGGIWYEEGMWDLRPSKGSEPGCSPTKTVGSWESYLTFLSLSFLGFKMGMKTLNCAVMTMGGTQQMASLAPPYWRSATVSTDPAPATGEPHCSSWATARWSFVPGTWVPR